MKKITQLTFLFTWLFCLSGLVQANDTFKTEPFVLGQTLSFDSQVLNEKRVVNIYLPAGYSAEHKQGYPVIYLLDGSKDEDFIHIAGLAQYANFSWVKLLPPSIIVGVANVDRQRDYTYPTHNLQDQKDVPTSGGSARFIAFLKDELQPLIAKTFNANDHKSIIGQSLGGLVAAEIAIKQPQLFDNYIIVSPSLWWDDESLLKVAATEFTSPKGIFIAVGEEGEIMRRTAAELFEKLKAVQPKGGKINFQFYPKNDHGDTLHLAVYDAFDALFSTKHKAQ